MADDEGFGGLEPVLLAQEEKLAAFAEENRVLGAAVESLQAKLKAAEGRAAAATKRASEAEARLHARSAADSGVAQQLADKQQEAERLRHRLANETLLREQAERGRRDAEQAAAAAQRQAAALRDESADLRERLAAAQRQVLQLESLQPFADSWEEQQHRERELRGALEAANSRAAGLEARCVALERELGDTAAALAAAQQLADGAQQQLADSRARQQRQQQQQLDQQQHGGRRSPERRADSLALSDLADLGGAETMLPGGCASPQRSSGAMPSREWALQRRQAAAAEAQRRQQAAEAADAVGAEAAANAAQLSLVADLQRQLLEQQRQLAALLDAPPGGEGGGRAAAALEAQLEKLKRRNTHLQTALAEASLQHARAAGAAQKQLQDALQDVMQLRQQRDAAAEQLAQLQAAAAALGVDGSSGGAACSAERLEQLHGELIEYASRCNEAVEQNAVLQAEKRAWLERLRAAEGEAQRHRAEASALRLQRLELGAAGMGVGISGSGGSSSGGNDAELLERLLEAQAAEAALRSLLDEAREQQVAAAKALSSELRRVHALERLRISDVAEVQRLQRCVHELQVDCQRLGRALAAAQQQLAGSAAKRWAGGGGGGGAEALDFKIAAHGGSGAF